MEILIFNHCYRGSRSTPPSLIWRRSEYENFFTTFGRFQDYAKMKRFFNTSSFLASVTLLVVVFGYADDEYTFSTSTTTTPKPPPGVSTEDIILPKDKHTATLIFLHRSGVNGTLMREWIQLLIGDYKFPHIKIIFPTAPTMPYTALENRTSTIWYDQEAFNPFVKEMPDTFNRSAEALMEIIKSENEAGIRTDRIVVGGFSMGGVMALHFGYRFEDRLAGVFGLSAFLNNESCVFEALNRTSGRRYPPPKLFMATGDYDEFAPVKWAKASFDKLRETEILYGEFFIVHGMLHSVQTSELARLVHWLGKVIPENYVDSAETVRTTIF